MAALTQPQANFLLSFGAAGGRGFMKGRTLRALAEGRAKQWDGRWSSVILQCVALGALQGADGYVSLSEYGRRLIEEFKQENFQL